MSSKLWVARQLRLTARARTRAALVQGICDSTPCILSCLRKRVSTLNGTVTRNRDSRVVVIEIDMAVDTLLEQFSRRKYEGRQVTSPTVTVVMVGGSACNQHRAICQQRRRMSVPCRDERARRHEAANFGGE